eukprot:gene28599-3623_t
MSSLFLVAQLVSAAALPTFNGDVLANAKPLVPRMRREGTGPVKEVAQGKKELASSRHDRYHQGGAANDGKGKNSNFNTETCWHSADGGTPWVGFDLGE